MKQNLDKILDLVTEEKKTEVAEIIKAHLGSLKASDEEFTKLQAASKQALKERDEARLESEKAKQVLKVVEEKIGVGLEEEHDDLEEVLSRVKPSKEQKANNNDNFERRIKALELRHKNELTEAQKQRDEAIKAKEDAILENLLRSEATPFLDKTKVRATLREDFLAKVKTLGNIGLDEGRLALRDAAGNTLRKDGANTSVGDYITELAQNKDFAGWFDSPAQISGVPPVQGGQVSNPVEEGEFTTIGTI